MFLGVMGLNAVLSRFFGRAAGPRGGRVAGDMTLCLYGQPTVLTFIGTAVDGKTNHAVALIDARNIDTGAVTPIRMNCIELREVLESYSAAGAGDHANAHMLHSAATQAQAHDSALHKPQDGADGPNSPHGFL